MATGYATARPYLHPEIIEQARAQLGLEAALGRALDVGCGTGMSSLALLALAREVVGTDSSLPMLRRARRQPGLGYVAASAERLPFRAGCFELVVLCGSIDWVDRSRFLPRAKELLAPGGWLVSLDFGDAGRSPEVADLERWYREVFERRYPRPPARDPIITADEAARFGLEAPSHTDFATERAFSAREYAAFLMTESNVIAAVEHAGADAAKLRARLVQELQALFGDEPRRIDFGGYVQALRRP